jgi:hypothetical protein
VLVASQWSKVARSEHYRWLHEDPSYRGRFEAADRWYMQTLKDEAVRRAHEGIRKLVLYKGQPVFYQGEPVYEHIYSDNLLIKLLEAGDPDKFNPQKVAPFDENFEFDNLTEGQVRKMLEWLRKRIETAKSMQAMREPEAQLTAAVEATTTPEPATPQRAATSGQHEAKDTATERPVMNIPSVFKGDGWPYKVEKKKMKR